MFSVCHWFFVTFKELVKIYVKVKYMKIRKKLRLNFFYWMYVQHSVLSKHICRCIFWDQGAYFYLTTWAVIVCCYYSIPNLKMMLLLDNGFKDFFFPLYSTVLLITGQWVVKYNSIVQSLIVMTVLLYLSILTDNHLEYVDFWLCASSWYSLLYCSSDPLTH